MKIRSLALLVLGLSLSYSSPAIAAGDVHEWDFLVAHKPRNTAHVKLIREFAERVKKKTDGKLVISLRFSDIGVERTLQRAVPKVYSGDVEMSQIPINRFLQVSQTLDVLDMPMMFRDHAHAHTVLDGQIGAELRDSVAMGSNGNIRGLSFTYSGGWRNVYSTEKLDSVADLRGMKMRTRNGRMGNDAMDGLGVDFFSYDGWKSFRKLHKAKTPFAEEAETNRLLSYQKIDPSMVTNIKTVMETNHSLYLTMISVNGDAFNKLTKKQKEVLAAEARLLAQEERTLSIDQAAEGKVKLQKLGIQFVQTSEQDRAILEQMAAKIYKKYENTHGDLIKRIKAVDSPALAQTK